LNIKKLAMTGAATAIMLGSMVMPALADSPRPQRGDVTGATPDTFNAEWVTGTSQDGGAKGQSIEMTNFAYYSFPNWWDQDLSDVTKVRTSFLTPTTTANSGGSPRFSLQLDANGDGIFVEPTGNPSDEDVNVFLDPAHCSDLAPGAAGVEGWREANFTGDKTDCAIYTSASATPFVSDSDGTAWSKLVAAYPDAKVWFMFLIQDATTGSNFVDRIYLDNAFFTNEP